MIADCFLQLVLCASCDRDDGRVDGDVGGRDIRLHNQVRHHHLQSSGRTPPKVHCASPQKGRKLLQRSYCLLNAMNRFLFFRENIT